MKFLKLTLALVLVSILFPHALAAQEIRIGWIGPLTGNAAVLGVQSAPAVQLAVDQANSSGGINGQHIKLLIEDDQYETRQTVTAYQKLVHGQGVKILFVVTYGGIFALAERAAKDGVILIDPLDCDSAIGSLPKNVFCIAKRTEDLGEIIAKEITDQLITPVALLYYDGDPFMGSVAEAFKKSIDANLIAVPVVQTYNNDATDFKSFLVSARAKNVKGIVLLGYDQLGSTIRMAKEMQMNSSIFALASVASPASRKLSGKAIEGVSIAVWKAKPTKLYQDFVVQLEKRTRSPIAQDAFAVPPYDAARFLLRALATPGVIEKNEAVYEQLLAALYNGEELEGPSGKISINADGTARGFSSISTYQVKGEKLVPIRDYK